MSSVFTFRCTEHHAHRDVEVPNNGYHRMIAWAKGWPLHDCGRRMVLVRVRPTGKHLADVPRG